MLKGKIKARKIKQLFDIAEIIHHGDMTLKAMKTGFEAVIVDPAHVVMAELKLGKKAFEEYSSADDVELGIDFNKMMPILKLASSDTPIEFEYDEKEKGKGHLTIRIENLVRRLSLVDMSDVPTSKFPDIKLPGIIGIKTEELTKGVKASADVSDYFKLNVTKDFFELSAAGDTDEVNMKLTKDLLTELKTDEPHTSLFAIDYFRSLIKYAPENLKLGMATDKPIKIQFLFADGEGTFTAMQAPRIEAD